MKVDYWYYTKNFYSEKWSYKDITNGVVYYVYLLYILEGV